MLEGNTIPELLREESKNFWTEAPKKDTSKPTEDNHGETEVLNLLLNILQAYILKFVIQPIVKECKREALKFYCTFSLFLIYAIA